MTKYDEIKKQINEIRNTKINPPQEYTLLLTTYQRELFKEQIPPNQLVYDIDKRVYFRNGIEIHNYVKR